MNLQSNQQSRYFGYSLHALGAAVTALTVGLFFALVYQPLVEKREQNVSRAEQIDRLLQSHSSEGSDYRRLRSQLEEMKGAVAELHSQLAQELSEEALLADISEIAAESDLQILDYQVGSPKSLLTHSITEIGFSCHGSYASICKFLEKAEQITKIAKLSKFELESSENSYSYPIQLTFVLYSEGKSNDTREKRGVL